ncbi:MAG TPA: hypothetical protein VLF71_04750 [Candidatus Saccharimonadales bacterium]|nr:hypothetical protein [Candidatus Saccharimonadales bacterium]
MKKKQTHKQKKATAGRIAQAVTILATVMAAAYIIIRIINWVRFI